MNKKSGTVLLLIAAVLTGGTALAHMSCIWLGPTCFEMQMAPPDIVHSAQQGTAFAPIATTVVSTVFLIWMLYALSAAGKIRRLPLLTLGVYTISAICILRGVAIVPINSWFPETPLGIKDWVAGAVWAFTGLCFLVGYKAVSQK